MERAASESIVTRTGATIRIGTASWTGWIYYTTRDRELARFQDFIDPAAIREANALFGYEGDHYYFDLDIRTHFGLDKYSGDVIPFWKTETLEAIERFATRLYPRAPAVTVRHTLGGEIWAACGQLGGLSPGA